MATVPAAHEVERRKRVKLRLRKDLQITPQRYEGKTFYVVKDPVSLRYYRFKEQEHFLLGFLDGEHTLEEAQKAYEQRFRPERLTLEDLEAFAQQLLNAGLAQNESPLAARQLLQRRKKRKRSQLIQALTNILYIKIPIFDPDVILGKMLRYLGFVFSTWFFLLSLAVMGGAVLLVAMHFDTFRSKLPSYHEFFSFKTVVYLWVALGVVKVIHEFGHGLSCKKFGGEVHEMGFLFLVFSPCLYCNVSDSWTLPNKWHRIIISAAGIYVELIIAAIATFVWWNTPTQPFINNMALSLMVVCSVSTIVFNANPLMRYDGYYVLADWIEIPNLRERCNRYLSNLFLEYCLGVETQPEPYMALWRRWLFVIYAIVSYIYRWVITFFILWFIYNFLKPYKLGVISGMLALAALGSMIGWPIYRVGKNIHQRGRLPDMKPVRVLITCSVLVAVILSLFTVPLPVSRVTAAGVVEHSGGAFEHVTVPLSQDEPCLLRQVFVTNGQIVTRGTPLAEFSSRELEVKHKAAQQEVLALEKKLKDLENLKNDPDLKRDAVEGENPEVDVEREIAKVKGEKAKAEANARYYDHRLRQDVIIRATRDGMVSGLPTQDEVGKAWDKKRPLCKIGDPSSLRVIIPVTPADFALLKENLRAPEGQKVLLPVTVRVQGLAEQTWSGRVLTLPESEARSIPPALSSRAGGPIAIKPSSDPNELVPQAQYYLVYIEVLNPDSAIHPGVRARAKVHCKKRTFAWWVWRTINDTFNLGLM